MYSQVFCGTSGWAYSSWKPEFYPKEIPAKKFLEYYATQLTSVEVNYTFRHRLTDKTIAAWLAATPEHFRFSIKMHQAVTHFRRLKEADEIVVDFLESLVPFKRAEKLGCILIQLAHNMKLDIPRLDGFLGTLPRSFQFAVELRHESWLVESVYKTLRNHNVALCVTEGTDELSTPDISTASFGYYRLRRQEYSAKRIRELAEQFLSGQRETFCYLKHEETPEGALSAQRLIKSIRKLQSGPAA